MYQLRCTPHGAPEKGRGLWMVTGGIRRMQQASALRYLGLVGVTLEFRPFLRRSLEPPPWNNNAFTCCPVFPTPYTKINSKEIKELSVRPTKIKLRRKQRGRLVKLVLVMIFWSDTKSKCNKSKNQWGGLHRNQKLLHMGKETNTRKIQPRK